GGKAKAARGMIPNGMSGFSDQTSQYNYDPAKAKQLLAQAGYAGGGFTLDYIWETGYGWKRPLGELFQSNMKDLGITVNVSELAPSALFGVLGDPKTAAGKMWPVVLFPQAARPYDFMYVCFHTAAQGANGINWGYYSSPKFDDVIQRSVREVDKTKRDALY